jgi:DNA-binding cell septation regulator SpoVG
MKGKVLKMDVSLSEIEITPVKPREGLLAFTSFVLNGAFYTGDIAIYSRPSGEGYRLVYPIRVLPNGAKVNIFHPIRKDVAQEIEERVSEAYQELLNKVGEGRKRRGEINE